MLPLRIADTDSFFSNGNNLSNEHSVIRIVFCLIKQLFKYENTDRTGDDSPHHINRYMVDLGTERAAGTGRFSYPGEAFGDISAFDGTGYTDVVVVAFPADHTVHNPIREAD